MKRIHNQRGYTLIELMIASTVFSIILLGAASALIQVGRMYYKGVITSRTQGATRTIIDDITRSMQFTGATIQEVEPDPDAVPKRGAFCVGDTRYSYVLNAQITDEATEYDPLLHRNPHALWKEQLGPGADCGTLATLPNLSDPDLTGGQEVLEPFMRLRNIDIAEASPGSRVWRVSLSVIYGDDELLEQPEGEGRTTCKGLVFNAQWCAVSDLSTEVYKRIQ